MVKELLNFLPEYNPEPVLLINSEAKILYKNKSADNILKNKNISPLIVEYIKNKRDKFDFELSLPDSRVYKFLAYFIREHNVYLVYGFEITELKEKENHLNFLANYDVLTGLPNRNKLYNDMIELIDYKSVIILIDIKSMRQINSIYGYDTGNKYLVKFADFLKETFKEY